MNIPKKIVFLMVLVIFLIGCNGDPLPEISTSMYHPEEQELKHLPENVSIIDITSEEYQIATPITPAFTIWDGQLTSCLGQDYIVLEIQNMGPWAFQRGQMYATTGTHTFYTGMDETPFHGSGAECPVGGGATSLSPGEISHLYLPVEYSLDVAVTFDIRVTLCTYIGNDSDPHFPDSSNRCPYREYSIELLTYSLVFVEVLAEAVCPTGPDPLRYEIISSLFPGEIVELLGNAKEPGWVVVRNNLYNVPCFFLADHLNFLDEEAAGSKDDEFEPGDEKDTSCPQGEKYDFVLGECVTKCANYTNESACEKAGCTWDPPSGTSNYGTCQE